MMVRSLSMRKSLLVCCIVSAIWITFFMTFYRKKPPDSAHVSNAVESRHKTHPVIKDNFPMRYHPRTSSKPGIPFHVDPQILLGLGFWPRKYKELTKETLQGFVFATAVSHNHFEESLDVVVSIQRFFPKKKIYFYDIGMKPQQIKKVKKMCLVTYRKFDFDRFPGHVRHLRTYAFKPLIIQMLLGEFGGVFYVDSSVRFNHNRMDEVFRTAVRSGGIVGLSISTSTVFEVTIRERYAYFPTNIKKIKVLKMFQPGTLLVYRTKSVYSNIMYWWVTCMLEQYCGAPFLGQHVCKWQKARAFAFCDRYDQSTLNILAYNHYNFTGETFLYYPTKKSDRVLAVKRDTHEMKDKVKYCT